MFRLSPTTFDSPIALIFKEPRLVEEQPVKNIEDTTKEK